MDAVAAALQVWAVDVEEQPVIVVASVVVMEVMRVDDDGDTVRSITYGVPDDGTTLAACLGLLEAGQHYVRRDLFVDDHA